MTQVGTYAPPGPKVESKLTVIKTCGMRSREKEGGDQGGGGGGGLFRRHFAR